MADETEQRPVSITATVLGATLMAVAVLVGGLALAFAFGVWRGDILGYMRPGFALALAASAASAIMVVASSYAVRSILAHPQPASPVQSVISVVPIGSAPGDTIRIVPLAGSERMIDNVKEDDLRYFIEGLRIRGHTKRAWLGVQLPSGAIIDGQMWRSLSSPLRKVKVIKNVGPRRKGHMMTRDAQRILSALGLNDPYQFDD